MAQFLPIMTQFFLRSGAIAVQGYVRLVLYPGTRTWSKTFAQFRGTKHGRSRNCIMVQIILAGRCAYPGIIGKPQLIL